MKYPTLKYPTLAELKAAYESGALSRDDPLTIDNDATTVYLHAEIAPGEWDSTEKVFDGGPPSCLLEEALTLVGIPWQNA